MKETNRKRQIGTVQPLSLAEPTVNIHANDNLGNHLNKVQCSLDKKAQGQPFKPMPSIQSLLSYQNEIKRLQSMINKLKFEKSILIKWVNFFY